MFSLTLPLQCNIFFTSLLLYLTSNHESTLNYSWLFFPFGSIVVCTEVQACSRSVFNRFHTVETETSVVAICWFPLSATRWRNQRQFKVELVNFTSGSIFTNFQLFGLLFPYFCKAFTSSLKFLNIFVKYNETLLGMFLVSEVLHV